MRVYALFCVLFLFSRLLENRVLKFNLLFRDTSNFVVQIGQIELATGMSNNDVYIALGGDVTICDTSKHNGRIEHYLHYNVIIINVSSIFHGPLILEAVPVYRMSTVKPIVTCLNLIR